MNRRALTSSIGSDLAAAVDDVDDQRFRHPQHPQHPHRSLHRQMERQSTHTDSETATSHLSFSHLALRRQVTDSAFDSAIFFFCIRRRHFVSLSAAECVDLNDQVDQTDDTFGRNF